MKQKKNCVLSKKRVELHHRRRYVKIHQNHKNFKVHLIFYLLVFVIKLVYGYLFIIYYKKKFNLIYCSVFLIVFFFICKVVKFFLRLCPPCTAEVMFNLIFSVCFR